MENGVVLKWLSLLLVTSSLDLLVVVVGARGFEVAVAMLQGATAAFSASLRPRSSVFPTLFQPGRKFPHKPR